MSDTILATEYTKKLHLAELKYDLRKMCRQARSTSVIKSLLVKHGLNYDQLFFYHLFLRVYFKPRTLTHDKEFFSQAGVIRLVRKEANDLQKLAEQAGYQRRKILSTRQETLKKLFHDLLEKGLVIYAERSVEDDIYPKLFENIETQKERSTWNKKTYQTTGEEPNYEIITCYPSETEQKDIYAAIREPKHQETFGRERGFGQWEITDIHSHNTNPKQVFPRGITLLEGSSLLQWFFFESNQTEGNREEQIKRELLNKSIDSRQLQKECEELLYAMHLRGNYCWEYVISSGTDVGRKWVFKRLEELSKHNVPISEIKKSSLHDLHVRDSNLMVFTQIYKEETRGKQQ